MQAPASQNYINGHTVMRPEVVEVVAWSECLSMSDVLQLTQISHVPWRLLAPTLRSIAELFHERQREITLYRIEWGDHSEVETEIPSDSS